MITIKRDTYDHSDEDRVIIPEGRALVEIETVKEDDADYLELRYRVKAHEDPAVVGLSSDERFYLSDRAIKRLACLLKRLGIIERGGDDADLEFDPQDLVGADVVVDFTHEHKERKDGSTYSQHRWGFLQFWSVTDDRVKEFMAASKGGRPSRGNGGSGSNGGNSARRVDDDV